MQNSGKTSLLKDFYGRHRPLIDALAQDDEMFRAVKEIAGTEADASENAAVMRSPDKRHHNIPGRGGTCLS